jgi:hypothetical protein
LPKWRTVPLTIALEIAGQNLATRRKPDEIPAFNREDGETVCAASFEGAAAARR